MLSYFTFLYIYIGLLSLSCIYSKARQFPVKISKSMIIDYNLCNILYNSYIVYNLTPYLLNKSLGYDIEYNIEINFLIFLQYFTKYLDCFYSIFMILNKDWNRINFFTVYNNSMKGILQFILWNNYQNISAATAFSSYINSITNCIIYTNHTMNTIGYNIPIQFFKEGIYILNYLSILIHSLIWVLKYPEYKYFGLMQIYYILTTSILSSFQLYNKSTNHSISKSTNKFIKNKENLKIITNNNIKDIIKVKIYHITYDITSFISKHPGGNIINHYNDLDATDIFNVFHSNSNYARTILKNLPIINYYDTDNINNEDFKNIMENWKNTNLFKSNKFRFVSWSLFTIFLTITGVIMQLYNYIIMGGIISGIGLAHCGFVQYHLSHKTFTGKSEIDYLFQNIFEGLIRGGSSSWQRERNNKHHAMIEILDKNPIETIPSFAWNLNFIKTLPNLLLKIQEKTNLPLLIIYHAPVYYFTNKYFILSNKLWDELGLIILHFALLTLVCVDIENFSIYYIIAYFIQHIYYEIMIGLNHFTKTKIEKNLTDWAALQIKRTCNWGVDSIFARYLSGFLNLQIEHFLIPNMPSNNYQKISKDVELYANKNNIKYKTTTFYSALIDMVSKFKKISCEELKLRETNQNN